MKRSKEYVNRLACRHSLWQPKEGDTEYGKVQDIAVNNAAQAVSES